LLAVLWLVVLPLLMYIIANQFKNIRVFQKYDEWKNSLPEIPWLKDNENMEQMRENMSKMRNVVGEMMEEGKLRVGDLFEG
jgi:hypothetical protein